ncbi:MAG: hypothetical protein ABIJ59_00240 [Pseudomonadota bacterium]
MTTTNNRPSKKSRPQRSGLRWLLIIGIFFGQVMIYTWVRTESTQMLLHVSKAQGVLTQEQSYKKALLVERDRLKSDDRITRIAKTRLNLSGDTALQTIYMNINEG